MAEANETSMPLHDPVHTRTGDAASAGRARARWTHVALPCADLEASVAFYTTMTPLEVVHRHGDADGRTAWLAQTPPEHRPPGDGAAEDDAAGDGPWAVEASPFVLVLVEASGSPPGAVLAPFAHLGVELAARQDVDAVAERGRAAGCLHWEPADLPEPVGYVCALRDPDGNVVEFSHGQDVAARVRRRRAATAAGEDGLPRGTAAEDDSRRE